MMFLRKLCLVIWKNLVIRKRHWILTILEIVIPILLFIVAYIVRNDIGNLSSAREYPTSYGDIWTEEKLTGYNSMMYSGDSLFLYAPDNDFTKKMVHEVTSRLKKHEKVAGFDSEDELIGYYEALNDTLQDELMKMMGLKSWMLWLGWMINALLVNIVSVTIIVLLVKPPFKEVAILQHSNGLLVWLILMFYCAAGVAFCFGISSFFSRRTVTRRYFCCATFVLQLQKLRVMFTPTLAMSIGVLLWIISYAAPFSLVVSNTYVSPGIKLLTSLLPNTAISWTYRLIVAHESKGVGLTWTNIFEPPSGIRGDLSVGIMWLMLIVDIILYCVVTWYVNSIMPGKYGLAKPWYFIFMPSYWRSRKVDSLKFSSHDETNSNGKFEKPHDNLSVGIKIENLYKVFKSIGGMNKKVAVDGVTLDIYSGEITALLGHNGAGKTTTMSILTGMFSPTSGSVYIGGYDIRDNLDKVRESLGLCPQHNLLFTDLTVLEHLLFFAMLKGCSNREANEEARDLLHKLNLEEKKNQLCSTLSGGMKRKLSLGIALIGHTKVLMLDEPTSGMDPEARREIWDLLLNMRGERTILITTHFMEEADVLGDRIAIMDHGRVQCYGTSLFLKKLYGTGYQLNLLKEEGCNVTKLTETIQRTIPEAKVKSEMGSLLCYMLPAEQTGIFPDLFDVLEREKQNLGISSIGVSITTLEEVFLRLVVGKEAEDETDGQAFSESSVEYMKLTGSSEALTFKKKVGVTLMVQQFSALLMKRILFTYRKWLAFALQALIPIGMALLTILLSASTGSSSEPPRTMNLSDYGTTEVLYSTNPDLLSWSNKYAEIVKSTGSNIQDVPDVSAALLQAGETAIKNYRNNYIIAAEFNSSGGKIFNGMFSSIGVHSAPISLNVLTNAILKTKSSEKSIVTINHPLHLRETSIGDGFVNQVGIMILWMTLMPFGLLFLTGSFLSFPLMERVSKAKQLQLMTGASPLSYWFTCFLWDLFAYLVIAFIMMLIVLIADPLDVFNRGHELGE
ncbi:hypothetical protein ANN_10600 [Periplaneta americana]|uniref:ABC transporter domain-containing protein n=1 Tax=Periplaneta americana TaxID=6978 RepID=A0ABQ8TR28_PERAM|nr:hypothetical protein ANN_10600 [Periplaneta americana]